MRTCGSAVQQHITLLSRRHRVQGGRKLRLGAMRASGVARGAAVPVDDEHAAAVETVRWRRLRWSALLRRRGRVRAAQPAILALRAATLSDLRGKGFV